MEYYSAIRRDEILPFATTWMGLEIIMLSEISHMTEKVENHSGQDMEATEVSYDR